MWPSDCSQGERHGNAKLSEDDVLEIRQRYEEDENISLTAVGREYGVTYFTVWDIVNRRTWRHV